MKTLVAVCLFFGVWLGGMVTTAEAVCCGCGNCWMQVYRICTCAWPCRYCRSDTGTIHGAYGPPAACGAPRARLIANETTPKLPSYQPGDCDDPLGCLYVFQITSIDATTGIIQGKLPAEVNDGRTYVFRMRNPKEVQVGQVYGFTGFGKSVYLDLHLPVGP
jgi:hypothetical protein